MFVDTEEKVKIVALSCIGTVLLSEGSAFLGVVCFAVMLPWASLARVAAWLVSPLLNLRFKKSVAHSIVVQAEARPL
jgi:hypothetical protein